MGRDEKARVINMEAEEAKPFSRINNTNTGKSNKIKTEKGSWDLAVTEDLYSTASAEQRGTLMPGT